MKALTKMQALNKLKVSAFPLFLSLSCHQCLRTGNFQNIANFKDNSNCITLDSANEAHKYLDNEGQKYLDDEDQKYLNNEAQNYLENEAQKYFGNEAQKYLDNKDKKYLDNEVQKYLDD